MNRLVSLLATADIGISRFDHPRGQPHQDPAEEVSDEFSINLVERGSFDIQVGRQRWILGPGHVFLCAPGLAYRCRHQELFPVDACLAVTYGAGENREEGVEGVLTYLRRLASANPVLPPSNHLAYLFRPLAFNAYVTENRMAAETCANALLAGIHGGIASTRKPYTEHQLDWYAERIDAARGLLDQDYASQHSLVSLARSVGMSTFHFDRLFAELVGVPPHRYLLRVRLDEAARRLHEGASVTEACFATGFNNLSYFIRAFRSRFGIPPSKYQFQRIS
jgi:AraC family transcriptional regulator